MHNLRMDVDSVYPFRHDTPTVDATFALLCAFNGGDVDIPASYRIALACDVTVEATDARGVFAVTGGDDPFVASHSLLDDLSPTKVIVGTQGQADFVLINSATVWSCPVPCLPPSASV